MLGNCFCLELLKLGPGKERRWGRVEEREPDELGIREQERAVCWHLRFTCFGRFVVVSDCACVVFQGVPEGEGIRREGECCLRREDWRIGGA